MFSNSLIHQLQVKTKKIITVTVVCRPQFIMLCNIPNLPNTEKEMFVSRFKGRKPNFRNAFSNETVKQEIYRFACSESAFLCLIEKRQGSDKVMLDMLASRYRRKELRQGNYDPVKEA